MDTAGMQKRFHALDEQLAPLKAKLRESDAPIVELEREMGLIAKSLNGKTGAT